MSEQSQKPYKINLRRKFRPGEWVAEKLVTLTAFVSLTFIVLIFVFVFKEAFTLFGNQEIIHSVSNTVIEEPMESYGEEMVVEHESSAENAAANEQAASLNDALESADVSDKNDNGDVVIGFSSLWKLDWQPISDIPKYGLWPLIVGSVKVTLISILIGGPLAILAALFTTTFAPKWARELMKPVIEILAGFPSVVIGFFALTVLATWLQKTFGFDYRLNAFTGGVAMSLAVIPIIFTLSEDALAAIPKSMSEASMALGARKWETALYILLPAATPGIFASLILGFGRAFGETMIVLMATGNAALLSINVIEPVRTLSATVGAEMAEVVFGEFHYSVLFFIGTLLFVISFTLNVIAEFYIRQRMMKKFKGA